MAKTKQSKPASKAAPAPVVTGGFFDDDTVDETPAKPLKPPPRPRKPRAPKAPKTQAPKAPEPATPPAAQINPKLPPLPAEPFATPQIGDGSTGSPFVRMLNRSGMVVPVPADDVIARLQNGYQFIHNEPAVPRSHGNPDVPDFAGPYLPRAGLTPPKQLLEAAGTWLRAMQQDHHAAHAGAAINPLVDWNWLTKGLPAILEKYSALLGGGGAKP